MTNKNFFMDLHIHVGRTFSGKPVKITASKQLTLTNIIKEAKERKGLDIIGIIDCHVPEVIDELKQLVRLGEAVSLSGGGLSFGGLTLILGTEMEIYDDNCQGPIHVLCYFPDIDYMQAFSQWMSRYQKNMTLSSQRSYVSAVTLQKKVKELEGLFIPAHIFTPYKSLYGKGVKESLTEVFDPALIDGVELGLSSDTGMADQVPELKPYTFLTNSDAHSLAKIGREYQQVLLAEADFRHVALALKGKKKQHIVANYGLDPRLGKYHVEVSRRLAQLVEAQRKRMVSESVGKRRTRPDYIHQVPLEFIPQLGPKGLERLLKHFGSEMKVLHEATREELSQVVGPEVVEKILEARAGKSRIRQGGGGVYGKLS